MSNARGLVMRCVRPGCEALYHVSRRSPPLKAYVCGAHSSAVIRQPVRIRVPMMEVAPGVWTKAPEAKP